MDCPKCGMSNNNSNEYCVVCGTKLSKESKEEQFDFTMKMNPLDNKDKYQKMHYFQEQKKDYVGEQEALCGKKSLIYGIISLILSLVIGIISLPLSIIAIVYGVKGKKKGRKGLLLGILSILIGIIVFIFFTTTMIKLLFNKVSAPKYIGTYSCGDYEENMKIGDFDENLTLELTKDNKFIINYNYDDNEKGIIEGNYKEVQSEYTEEVESYKYELIFNATRRVINGNEIKEPASTKFNIIIGSKGETVLYNQTTTYTYACIKSKN